jgi:hypothetical protein
MTAEYRIEASGSGFRVLDEAYMQEFGIDRDTAEYWIHSAMGG